MDSLRNVGGVCGNVRGLSDVLLWTLCGMFVDSAQYSGPTTTTIINT